MKSKKTLVLVDFSNLCFACWYPAVSANKADSKYDPHEVFKNNLDGKLGTLFRTLEEIGLQEYIINFVEDRKSLRKYELWPAYKANRPPLEHDPRPEAKTHLISKGYKGFLFSPDNEADDAIAAATALVLEDRDVIICSSDKDLWQLKRPGVDIWQLTKDRFVTDEMIAEEFRVSQVSQIPIVKALWGDSGDNVPNAVPRMQKQLMPLVSTSSDLEHFLTEVTYLNMTPRCRELLEKGEEQVRLNYKLVKLDDKCPIEASEIK
jgi:DNA polymerase I